MHRGVATVAAPRGLDVTASDAAAPRTTPGCAEKQEPKESPHHLLIPGRVPGTGSHVATGAEKARYPLMTTLMPVTEVPVTAGAKVARWSCRPPGSCRWPLPARRWLRRTG